MAVHRGMLERERESKYMFCPSRFFVCLITYAIVMLGGISVSVADDLFSLSDTDYITISDFENNGVASVTAAESLIEQSKYKDKIVPPCSNNVHADRPYIQCPVSEQSKSKKYYRFYFMSLGSDTSGQPSYPTTVSVNMPLTTEAAEQYVKDYQKRNNISLTNCSTDTTNQSITCDNPDNTKCTFTFSKFINENQFENDTAESHEEAQKKVKEYANCSGTSWAAKNQNIVNCRVDGDGFQQEFKFNFKEIKNLSLSEEQQKLVDGLKSDIQIVVNAFNKRKAELEKTDKK